MRESVIQAMVDTYDPDGDNRGSGLALSGLLLNNGVELYDGVAMVLEARNRLGDRLSRPDLDDAEERIRHIFETTAEKIANGEHFTGAPTLEEFYPGMANAILVGLGRASKPGHMLLTDMGNAERFVNQHAGKIRWVPKYNRWIAWDGKRWKLDDGGVAVRLAKETARCLYGEAQRERDPDKSKALARWAIQSQDARCVGAMIMLAKPDMQIEPKMLDSNPWSLNVENGTIDLQTGELREHDPADLITKLAPVEYDPDACAPRFEQFLREVLVEDDLIAFVQRLFGYSLTGSVRERSLEVLHGVGKNGKGTLVELFQDMLGDYSATIDVEVLLQQRYPSSTSSYHLAELAGARFVSTSEVEEDRQLAEGRIKAITGADTISARAPYGKPFSYRPQFKLWISTNHKPVIKGTDDAIWDRIKLIPFTQRFEGAKADTTLPEQLRKELSGVLAWAVRGTAAWLAEGLQDPPAVSNATRAYRKEMDRYSEFFEEMCVLDDQAVTKASVLWMRWESWLRDNGDFNNPGTKAKFKERMQALGGVHRKTGRFTTASGLSKTMTTGRTMIRLVALRVTVVTTVTVIPKTFLHEDCSKKSVRVCRHARHHRHSRRLCPPT
jgi:putative DNA primase/helicase